MIQVLVCEDDGTTRLLLKSMLSRAVSCEIVEVRNGAEALEILGRRTFDLLLLDLNMPVMNGVETLRQIRETPDLKDLPVLILSSENEEEQVRAVLGFGVLDFLLKPVGRENTQARLLRAIAGLERRPTTHLPGPRPNATDSVSSGN